jgi:flagellar motor switch protein FliN/FliY
MSTSIPDFDKLGTLGGVDEAGTFGADNQEAELNKAIEELRGVLHDEDASDIQDPAGSGQAAAAPVREERAANAGIIMNIPVDVQIVLGSAEMPVSELMALQKGSTVALDRRIGEPVDVVVNGRKIASGEITVLENDPSRFGIKLTQIIDAAKPS